MLSIITVVKGASTDLLQTARSLNLLNKYCEIEWIIQEAPSDDMVVDLSEAPSRKLHIVEEDKGIYDAMNRACAHITGEIVLFLNAGDTITDTEAVAKIVAKAHGRPNSISLCYYSRGVSHKRMTLPQKLSRWYYYRNHPCHQTQFWHIQLLKKNLPFNTRYKILADRDMFIRAAFQSPQIIIHKVVGIHYKGGGLSMLKKMQALKLREFTQINQTFFSPSAIAFYEVLNFVTLRFLRIAWRTYADKKSL